MPVTQRKISDAAYGAGWNGDTTFGASKNALYDKIETISAGSGSTKDVAQTAHGLAVGDVIKNTGTDDTYSKAQADSVANAEVVGIVTTVTDANNFTYTFGGIITTAAAVPAVAAGTALFLSPSSAGALTSTKPTTTGQVVKPLAIMLNNDDTMLWLNMRGMLISEELTVDGTPSSDHSASGTVTSTFNAGATITVMDLCYMASDGEWALADADATSTAGGVMLAISLESKTDGNAMKVALPGSFVRDDTWNWTPGAPLYVSTTPGAITATAPSGTDDVVRVVGYAVTADVIHFNPASSHSTVV